MLFDDSVQFNAWRASPRARLFMQYEHRLLQQLLPRLTGYRCVQIDCLGLDRNVLDYSSTLCHWRMGAGEVPGVDVRFDGRHLPLASASVDALVLTHGLEAIGQPHALLRECARVLNERGQLIVLVFNPLSLWFLRQNLLPGRQPRFLPCGPPPSASRLCDWLRLLEFEPEQVWRYGLGFPLFGRLWRVGSDARWLRSVAWSAQAYALVARRQTASRTPLVGKPARRRARPAAALARESLHRVR